MRCGKDGCCCEEIKGLAHIGVYVKDIERSKDFYKTALCFECFFEHCAESEKGVTKVAFLRRGSCVIELVELPVYEERASNGVIAHIALDVTDVELVKICLEKKGVKFNTEKPVSLPSFFKNGVKFIMLSGPDGEVIELNQTL